jgi:hypothetical protein
MTSAELLADAFGRVRGLCHRVLEGVAPEHLSARLDPKANTIAWLIWHLSRIQDDHLADAAGREQVWLAGGWAKRCALPFEEHATGYGQSAEEVAALGSVSAELLLGYFDATVAATIDFVSGLHDEDLDRIVDATRTPPVSLGVRLVSVISDNLQHVGQAAYVRGCLERG